MINFRSSLILFSLVNLFAPVHADELCNWKLVNSKKEFKFLDLHNLDYVGRKELIKKTTNDFDRGRLTPSITCLNDYAENVKSSYPNCYTSWKSKIKYESGGTYEIKIREEVTGLHRYIKSMPMYSLVSFTDKNNKQIKLFTKILGLGQVNERIKKKINQNYQNRNGYYDYPIYIEGIVLDTRKKFPPFDKPDDKDFEFKIGCNRKRVAMGPANWNCNKGNCTRNSYRLNSGYLDIITFYELNNEYRPIAIIAKESLKFKIKKLNNEKGSF